MTAIGFGLFDTAIGRCAIAWSERGVVGVQLPEAREALTRALMRRRHPQALESAPPPEICSAAQRVAALLRGERDDLTDIVLDMSGVSPFEACVYEIARRIAPGHTLTYGEVADRLGVPGAARAVGRALGRNPFAPIVPCHRVLAAGGRPGGFSAEGGVATKLRLLSIERARIGAAPGLFDR